MNKEICEKGKIVINRCLEKGYSIEPLKLQQLLILMHGVSLAKFNKSFFEEPVLATNYGLVLEWIEEEFGEYPQYVVEDLHLVNELERLWNKGDT